MTEEEKIKEAERRQRAEDVHDEDLAAYLRQIGAKNLAAELNDLRFRNRVMEARRWLDFHEARISYEEQLHDKIDQRMMANQSLLFDKAQAYTNFVVTLGYAGFFAIWNLIKGFMHPWDMKLVAVLLGASLMAFIVWTMVSMLAEARSVLRLGNAIRAEVEDREARIEAIRVAELENLQKGLRLQRFWLPTFVFSIVTGFAAGMILLNLMLFDLIGMPFSVQGLLFSEPPLQARPIPILSPAAP